MAMIAFSIKVQPSFPLFENEQKRLSFLNALFPPSHNTTQFKPGAFSALEGAKGPISKGIYLWFFSVQLRARCADEHRKRMMRHGRRNAQPAIVVRAPQRSPKHKNP